MGRGRKINLVICFCITMLGMVFKFKNIGLGIYEVLMITINTIAISIVVEHIMTYSIVKHYDDMRCINLRGNATAILVLQVMMIIVAVIIIILSDTRDSMSSLMGIPAVVNSVVILDRWKIYVGRRYICFQNQFIKIEEIESLNKREIARKNKQSSIELIITTISGKQYVEIFDSTGKTVVTDLENVVESSKLAV